MFLFFFLTAIGILRAAVCYQLILLYDGTNTQEICLSMNNLYTCTASQCRELSGNNVNISRSIACQFNTIRNNNSSFFKMVQ
jgi:hypothetical protein